MKAIYRPLYHYEVVDLCFEALDSAVETPAPKHWCVNLTTLISFKELLHPN